MDEYREDRIGPGEENEETSVLILTDENGVEIPFEYLDCIEYQGSEYLVLAPCADLESGDDNLELTILRAEPSPEDEELEDYFSVEDETVLLAVYEIFKERYKDVLQFAD